MNRTYSLLILLLLSFASLFGEHYENLVVESIDIIGHVPENSYFDPVLVDSFIKTKAGTPFSQVVFDNDLKVLAGEYDRVEPIFEVVNKKLIITLKIWPKPLIRSIVWNGNIGICSEDLQKELGISICTVFDRLGFNKAFHKLKAHYIKRGYFESELSYSVNFDPCTSEVDICISINEGRSGWISRIYFHGFCPDEEEEILAMMVTKKFNVFSSWLTSEGLYNEEAIQHDQSQIINYLQNEGYADAMVFIEAKESPTFFERLHLHITAERGEQFTLGAITFEGNTLFSDEEVMECFTSCEGDCFSPEKIRAMTTRIEALYGRKGYIDASVSFEPKLELQSGCVYSVHLHIEEGESYCVGMIKVFGNCTTQTNVILHEILLCPGEVFNTGKLELTEMRLKNIGYFENVNVYAVKSEEADYLGNFRDVHIEVEEKQTGRFSTFFGYSTVETLFGGFSITEKNFNSAGLAYLFSKQGPGLRGGGEFLSASIQLGLKSRSLGLSWTKPYFMDSRWSVGFDIENSSNRYISDDYDIKALGYSLRATREINAFMRFGVHYRIRHSKTNLNHNVFGRDQDQLYQASRIHGLISAVGFTLGFDSTDSIEFPTRGLKSSFEMEYAGLGGDHTFASLAYINSQYVSTQPIFPGVIKFKADYRIIQPLWKTDFNHLPMDERLFLGGDNIMRGFKAYKIGPRFKNTDDPRGGLVMQIYTMEYNQILFKNCIAFLFADAGSLSKEKWTFGPLYASYGFGLRLKVIESIPPLTIGLGFPVNGGHKRKKNFFFSFGGSF